jgi:hypothetical protein
MRNVHILPTDKPSRLWINNLLQGKLELSKEVLIGSNTAQHIYITSNEKIKQGDWCIYDSGEVIQYLVKLNTDNLKKIILTDNPDLIAEGVQPIDNEFLEWFVKNPSCEEVKVEKENICARCYSNDVDECWSAKECSDGRYDKIKYKIIIPQEEPKQELELKDFESSSILDVLNMGNVEYLGNGDIIYNPNLLFIKRDDKWFIKTEEPKQETLEETAKRLYEYQSQNPPYTIITPKAKIEGFIEGAKWQQERMYSEEEVKEILMKTDRFLRADLDLWFEQSKKK